MQIRGLGAEFSFNAKPNNSLQYTLMQQTDWLFIYISAFKVIPHNVLI